jgi:hypothetical protein
VEDVTESSKVAMFVRGLREQTRKWLETNSDNLLSLDKAVNAAIRHSLTENGAEKGEKALLTRTSQNPGIRGDEVRFCWRCLKPNHMARDCRGTIRRRGNSNRGTNKLRKIEREAPSAREKSPEPQEVRIAL